MDPELDFRMRLGKITSLVCPKSDRLWDVMKKEVSWLFKIDELTNNIMLMTSNSPRTPKILDDFILNMQDFDSIEKQARQSKKGTLFEVHLPQLGVLIVYQLLVQINSKMGSSVSDEIIKRRFGYELEIKADRGKILNVDSTLNKSF